MPSWRHMLQQVWLRRLALTAIAALAGLLYAWAMGKDTLEYYYAAAGRSLSVSSARLRLRRLRPGGHHHRGQAAGGVVVPGAFVRAFGLHTWAIILPQVIEGILTVLVLYRAVARLAGPAAGLIAALVLAVSPATVALDRENISDSLLVLLLVLAANAVSGAIAGRAAGDAGQHAPASDPDGPSSGAVGDDHFAAGGQAAPGGRGAVAVDSRRPAGRAARIRRPGGTFGRLILAGFWVGLAFQAKEIEAWMVLPALGLAYLLSGPGPVVERAASSRSRVWSSRWCRCPG